jgi:hypothetical protein
LPEPPKLTNSKILLFVYRFFSAKGKIPSKTQQCIMCEASLKPDKKKIKNGKN